MSWVQDRHGNEKLIAEQSPELWTSLCAALKEDVAVFNGLYLHEGRPVEYKNSKELATIRWPTSIGRDASHPESQRYVEANVSFEIAQRSPVVTCSYSHSPSSGEGRMFAFGLDDNGKVAFKRDGYSLGVEEVSRDILERMLFEDVLKR